MKTKLSVGYYIHLTSLYLKLFAQQTLKEHAPFMEITLEQYAILYVLSQEDGLYQRQFAKILMKDRPNITRMVDILENKKLLYRKADQNDRRIHKLYISESGRALVEKIEPYKTSIHASIAEPLSAEEQDLLLQLLEKMRFNIENKINIQI